jgi:acetyl-CoA carboxylase alpha subunit
VLVARHNWRTSITSTLFTSVDELHGGAAAVDDHAIVTGLAE